MYSGQEKTIIFCVVNKKEIVRLKELVDDIDPNAFVIVSDAREVHGEGFIEKIREFQQKFVNFFSFPLSFLVILY